MIIGIGGATGSGKTSVSQKLRDENQEHIALVYLDDYCRGVEEVPRLCGFSNWDSPESIDFESLKKDLMKLRAGVKIDVMTKNEHDNPDYWKQSRAIGNKELKGKRTHLSIEAKPLVLLEGFLVLAEESIRNLLDLSIFLDLNRTERMKRRTKFMDLQYEKDVLVPMEEKHVLPTAQYADIVVNVDKKTLEEVVAEVYDYIVSQRTNSTI